MEKLTTIIRSIILLLFFSITLSQNIYINKIDIVGLVTATDTQIYRNTGLYPSEEFEDSNYNGQYDEGEIFSDTNYNGQFDIGTIINDNNMQYKRYKNAYLKRLDNNPNNDEFVGKYSSGDLLILKDFYRRNREISILCFVGTYIINVLDASVDAHLFDYDISEDISLQIKPTSTANLNGLSLTLNL